MPRTGIVGLYGISISSFLRIFHSGCIVHVPINSAQGFVLLYFHQHLLSFAFVINDLFLFNVFCLHVCMSMRVSDPLELEWQTVVGCHGVLGIGPGSFGRVAGALRCWVTSPAPRVVAGDAVWSASDSELTGVGCGGKLPPKCFSANISKICYSVSWCTYVCVYVWTCTCTCAHTVHIWDQRQMPDIFLYYCPLFFLVFFFKYKIFFMCMSLPKCTWMSVVHSGNKRVLGPLELELQVVVSCHMDARNWTQVLCKSKVLLTTELLSSPSTLLFRISLELTVLDRLASQWAYWDPSVPACHLPALGIWQVHVLASPLHISMPWV